jgi:hypothetical protein
MDIFDTDPWFLTDLGQSTHHGVGLYSVLGGCVKGRGFGGLQREPFGMEQLSFFFFRLTFL